jgi:AraC family transcriptional regulator
LIEATLSGPIGLHDLAREASLSRFYFAKLFRNTAGHSPYQYVLERRIERAKEMLALGESSSAEIASALGFSSESHFSLSLSPAHRAGPCGIPVDVHLLNSAGLCINNFYIFILLHKRRF